MTELRVGIVLPTMEGIRQLGPGGIAEAARKVESAGLDAVAAPDVLVGDGTLAIESVVALSTAAAVTERVHIDFGVASLPTRPVAMLAAQVQALQYLSGDRVRLGVGLGGFAGSPFWRSLGAPERGRGRLADAALVTLPRLIAGEPTELGAHPESATVTLAPGRPVPPLLIGGGASDAVLRRAATYGDAWLPSALTTGEVAAAVARMREFADAWGRPVPRVLLGVHAVLGDDAAARDAMTRRLGEFFDMTPDQVVEITIAGEAKRAADRLAAYAEAGVDEVVLSVDGPDYLREVELVAEARSLLG